MLILCVTIGDYDEGKLYDRLARVCPRLTSVSGKHITGIGLRALGWMCGSTLTTLTFYDMTTNVNDIILLLQRCPLLKVFNLDLTVPKPLDEDPSENERVIQALVHSCPLLEELTLTSTSITDNCMLDLGALRKLIKLNIDQSTLLTRTGISRFLESNTQLESLIFTDVRAFSRRVIDLHVDSIYTSIALNCKRLKVLDVYNMLGVDLSIGLVTILSSCVNLEVIRIQDLFSYNYINRDNLLLALMTHCPNIVCINLGGCYSDAVLIDLFRTYPQLTELKVHKLTDSAIDALNQYCPLLEMLSTHDVSEAALCQFFECHPNLVEAPVINSKVALVSLARHCQRLMHLQIGFRTADYDISSFVEIERFHNLVSLSIALGTPLNNEQAAILATRCWRIRRLTLHDFSASGIVTMILHMPRLNVLTIHSSSQAVWDELVVLLKALDFKRSLYIHFSVTTTPQYTIELPSLTITSISASRAHAPAAPVVVPRRTPTEVYISKYDIYYILSFAFTIIIASAVITTAVV